MFNFNDLLAVSLMALSGPLPCEDVESYYASVNAGSSQALRASLHERIRGHERLPYTSGSALDTWDVLEIGDEDPMDGARVIDVYKNTSFLKGPDGNRPYNREHTWPVSYGFPNNVVSNYPYTDVHHLHLSDPGYNSSRGNLPFGSCNATCEERPTDLTHGIGGGTGVYPGNSNWRGLGVWEVWGARRGDVARSLLYLDVRYEGGTHPVTGHPEPDLILTDNAGLIQTSGGQNAAVAHMGLLSVLLAWHEADPPDDRDQRRNDAACSSQGNRNPFIDRPEFAACVFIGECGQAESLFQDGFESEAG